MSDSADLRRPHRKIRDRLLALVLVGTLLLMPPFAAVVLVEGKIAGIPIVLLYLFSVWIVLIAGAAILAPLLRQQDEPPPEPEQSPGEP